MEWLKRVFSNSPADPTQEMKRLSNLTPHEIETELKKARERLFSKYDLKKAPKQIGEGQVGFKNLGNTCFISASLQCLIHSPDIVNYFFIKNWHAEINPLTSIMQGKLVCEFYKVLFEYYTRSQLNPLDLTDLHTSISKVNKALEDFSQYDAQEFLSFFLDTLHEDLNKVVVRKYETHKDWKGEQASDYSQLMFQAHLRRNNSFIVDYFHGQFYSKIECPESECGHLAINCEPFNMISLNLSHTNSVLAFNFYYFPASYDSPLEKITINCLDSETIEGLLDHIKKERPEFSESRMKMMLYRSLKIKDRDLDLSKTTVSAVDYSPSHLILTERYSTRITKLLFGERAQSVFDETETNQFVLLLSIFSQRCFDGIEREVVVPKDIVLFEINLLIYLIHRNLFVEGDYFPTEIDSKVYPNTKEELIQEYGIFQSYVEKKGQNGPFELRVFSDENRKIYTSQNFFETAQTKKITVHVYFDFQNCSNKIKPRNIKSIELADPPFELQKITLKSCLDKFVQKEILDEENKWFCSKCKIHRRASKEMFISRLPKNLIIHFKRFKKIDGEDDTYRKFPDLITFETNELDVGNYCLSGQIDTQYELFAVCNHYGGVSTGHYTAFCRNLKTKNWVSFDDKLVKDIREDEVVSKFAYLLFYRRKDAIGSK